MSGRIRQTVLALSVGVVLADSSIVTLALPEILADFGGTVVGVSWVLTAFNLALALTILPMTRVARTRPRAGWALGMAVFVGSSAVCAFAGDELSLIPARVFQAVGGALTIACAIELLARMMGSHERAAPLWGTAGTIGVAAGPAVGGLLTELFSWEAIFLIQIPLLLLVPVVLELTLRDPEPGAGGELDLHPEVGLALLSAGLTGALFLLVILLTEGWGLSPLGAAATVSMIPVATYAARFLFERAGPPKSAAVAGGIAAAGGLAALAFLPGASWALTLQPQLLIGIGLALALPVLTLAAVGGRDPVGSRASSTIAARHAGIVIGIIALAPILSTQLESNRDAAQNAATSLLLDAPLPPETKLSLAEQLASGIDAAGGRLPDVEPSFAAVSPAPDDLVAYEQLEADIVEQIERGATNAFSLPFLAAGAFALLALIPIARLPEGRAG